MLYILTNTGISKKTQGFVLGLRDYHKLVITVLSSFYKKCEELYKKLMEIFSDFHASLKKSSHFMTELSKE